MNRELILASASRRRRALLNQVGIRFRAVPTRVRETVLEGEAPETHVLRLSQEKALEVGRLFPEHWVIGADTIVLAQQKILGKPRNRREALWMLQLLQGQSHEVYTGVCVLCAAEDKRAVRAVRTEVDVRPLSDEEMEWYVRTGEPFDKAGGYGIQGYGSVLIRGIVGSYTNVVGLPLAELVEMLREIGAWNLFASR